MAEPTERVESIAERDLEQVKQLNVHTKYYSNFFLLGLDIKVNGKSLQAVDIDKPSFSLKLQQDDDEIVVSFQQLLSATLIATKEFGVFQVGQFYFTTLPSFKVSFGTPESLHSFLLAVKDKSFQNRILTLLCQDDDGPLKQVANANVDSQLQLFKISREKETFVKTEVTEENASQCLETIENGFTLDFEGNIVLELPDDVKQIEQLNVHTKYYNSFFLLSVDIKVDGKTLQHVDIDKPRKFSLKLKQDDGEINVSFQQFLHATRKAAKECEVYQVGHLYYIESPAFKVSFRKQLSLDYFISHLDLFQRKLLDLLCEDDGPLKSVQSRTEINSQLLMFQISQLNNAFTKRKVTVENSQQCLKFVQKVFAIDSQNALEDEELNVRTVMKELAVLFPSRTELGDDLTEGYSWYTLGVMIGVPKPELDTIKQEYEQMKERKKQGLHMGNEYVLNDMARLTEVIDKWIKHDENTSWQTLCFGLYAVGTESLARDIANAYIPGGEDIDFSVVDKDIPEEIKQHLSVIEENKKELKQTQEELEQTKETNNICEEEAKKINDKLQSVTEEAEKLTAQLKGVEEEKERIETIKQEVTAKIGEESLLQKIISSMNELTSHLEQQIQDIHKEMTKQGEKKNELLEQKKELTQQLQQCEERLEKLKKMNQKLKNQQKEMSERLDENAAIKIYAVPVYITRTEIHRSGGISDNGQLINSLRRTIASLRDENNSLRYERNSLRHEKKNKLRDEKKNLRAEIKDEETKLRAEIDSLKDEKTKLRVENKSLKDEETKLRAENNSLKDEKKNPSELNSLQDEVTKLQAENKSLKHEESKLQAENSNLKNEETKLRAENRKLSQKVQDSESTNQQLTEHQRCVNCSHCLCQHRNGCSGCNCTFQPFPEPRLNEPWCNSQ